MASTMPYLSGPAPVQQNAADHKQKLRSACDSCHQCKVKCSGGSPCFRCASKGLSCRYGYQNRAGKPKGSKNRKTLERAHQLRMEWLTGQLRDANGELEDMNIDISNPTSLLPSPALSSTRWKPSPIPHPSSSHPTPVDQCIKPSEIEGDGLPSPQDLDAWTMDLVPILDPPAEGSSESLEAFTTPISFTHGDTYLGQPSDPTTPTTYDLPSPHLNLGITGGSCSCVQTQATNIATLHQLTCRDISDRFDLAMKSVTSTLETCEQFITCVTCDKSFPAILLTLSAIELIFTLFEQLTMNNRGLLPHEEQRLILFCLGDYKVSKEEGQAIQNVLLKMTLSKGRQTLDALHSLVNGPVDLVDEPGQSKTPGPDIIGHSEHFLKGSLSSVDRDYMTQCISRKNAALEALMTTVII